MDEKQDVQSNFSIEEKRQYTNFIESVKRHRESEKENISKVADGVINYILRQLNSDSLLAFLNQMQHQEVLNVATFGLFKVCYHEHYPGAKDYSLVERDDLFFSSLNLTILLLSLTFGGKRYELRKLEIDASRQTNLKLQQ